MACMACVYATAGDDGAAAAAPSPRCDDGVGDTEAIAALSRCYQDAGHSKVW